MYRKTTLLLLLITWSGANGLQVCPPPSMVVPCKCNSTMLLCSDIINLNDIKYMLTRVSLWKVENLVMENCVTDYIPITPALTDGAFVSMNIINSEFERLFESAPSKGSLDELIMNNVRISHGYDWGLLANIKIKRIHIVDAIIPTIAERNLKRMSPAVNELQEFHLEKTRTRYLSTHVFSDFHKLKYFFLTRTLVNDVTRDMFPKPWMYITDFGLSFNQLKTLPEKLFEDMPNLKRVFLEKNFLTTVPDVSQTTSNYILFHLTGNPIYCDCQMKWAVRRSAMGKVVNGECHEPSEYRGRPLPRLEQGDFAYCG